MKRPCNRPRGQQLFSGSWRRQYFLAPPVSVKNANEDMHNNNNMEPDYYQQNFPHKNGKKRTYVYRITGENCKNSRRVIAFSRNCGTIGAGRSWKGHGGNA
jgi:hypothetical protein